VELAHELKTWTSCYFGRLPAYLENMVIDFAQRIIGRLPADIKLFFKITRNRSFAEWYATDNL
jgi:6-pyruvoyltetrahydropterin/6-carboxytetrahydropterin synthase